MAVWPLTRRVFQNFPDRGWGLSKILGLLLVSWMVWILGSFHIMPFTLTTLVGVGVAVFGFSWVLLPLLEGGEQEVEGGKGSLKSIVFEELLFLTAFGFWSYARAFNPDIRGLEKFMDYGFMLSILRAKYFPPLDHFLAGETINYYYFGHLMAAILTRFSGVVSAVAFNLQIALLFGLTVLGAFSVGMGLYHNCLLSEKHRGGKGETGLKSTPPPPQFSSYLAGILAAIFVALIGNLHAISNVGHLNTYWYPTASRLIPNTINEFPLYSFVVADLHGHVSDIPIVLLIIGLLFAYVFTNLESPGWKMRDERQRTDTRKQMAEGRMTPFSVLGFQKSVFSFPISVFRIFLVLALALGATFATNSWDYPFFLILAGLFFLLAEWKRSNLPFTVGSLKDLILPVAGRFVLVFLLSVVLFLPYWLTVHPNVDGIGLVAFVDSFNPKDLQEIKSLPLPLYLFKRFIIRSPLNLLFILWGFYFFLAAAFVIWVARNKLELVFWREAIARGVAGILGVEIEIRERRMESKNQPPTLNSQAPLSTLNPPPSDLTALIMMVWAFVLVILPEWIYINDIYKPDYYRANTLFKFYYAAWIMLGIAVAYGLVRILSYIKTARKNIGHFLFLAVCPLLLASVLLYPVIALNSTTGGFKTYKGLDGVSSWMQSSEFEPDFKAIRWLNQNIQGQPTLVEAVGESYTDASRISAMTGLPTVLGWPVHEWLWRGSYSEPMQPATRVQKQNQALGLADKDTVGNRVADVKNFYETKDLSSAQQFLTKYQVSYVYLGKMEREKYPSLSEEKLAELGQLVYQNEAVKIYQVPSSGP